MNHSPEPWVIKSGDIHPGNNWISIVDANGKLVHYDSCNEEEMPKVRAFVDRIAACVNACQGIPTEALLALATGGSITLLGRPSELSSITITNDLPVQTDQTKQSVENIETKKI